MEKVVFIGGYDKSDMLIYISKLLTLMDKKVLIIDSTLLQKTRYIVPTMTPAAKYVTTFDGIDIAIGYTTMDELGEYLGIDNFDYYDYIIYDIDNPYYYDSFEIKPKDIHCVLTTFDVYSVQKALDVLRNIKQPTPIIKALVTRDPASDESDYLDFTTFNLKIKWDENIVYIPFETADLYEIFQNQRFSKVKLTGLSLEYMDSLSFLIETVIGSSRGDVKKALKLLEKES